MEKLQFIATVAVVCAALLVSCGTASSDASTIPVLPSVSTCEECVIPSMSIMLKTGENVTDPNDPCRKYKCLGAGQLQSITESCKVIGKCSDNKDPYFIPGKCCKECEYVAQNQFNLNRTTSEVVKELDSWGEWTIWTVCSRECGGGRHSRMRECNFQNKAVINCTGDRIQIEDCNTHECPIDGGWTRWEEWSECSSTCGNGTQMRARSCTDPTPMFGGKDCVGETQQVRNCFLRHCPVDCVWEPWSEWTECSVACGGGYQFQSRGKQVEKYGGLACEGLPVQNRTCNTHFCPIDGKWTNWSNWTSCTATCGNGTKSRMRSCSAPAPQYGGKDCVGEAYAVSDCFLLHCPVHCEWLEFSDWTACSVSCDGGVSTRTRGFVPAQHDGDDCTGDLMEVQDCNTLACPDPCVDNGNPCFEGVSCTKVTDTEFTCGACPRGLRGDGRGAEGCLPVNECEEASPCFPGAECVDLLEGYQCGDCPAGYLGETLRGYELHDSIVLQQVCQDVNECQLTENGGCGELRECENLLGSHVCGPCPSGYIEDGPLDCQFTNPCAAGVHNCQKADYCDNYAVGEYHCYCPEPLIGNGLECSHDTDLDGVPDTQLTVGCDSQGSCVVDNCPSTPNNGQEDVDGDGVGDVCDDDTDNDEVADEEDNCIYIFNPDQKDSDFDGHGNACDNCHIIHNVDQLDIDWDGAGDACDSDRDGDRILNTVDNCPDIYNPQQSDTDFDGWGDVCDNCLSSRTTEQVDSDQDGVGDDCDNDVDKDKDGIQNDRDNCLSVPNPDQLDTDGDGDGNACDTDDDGDGFLDHLDNCPLLSNPEQDDDNDNDIGDVCEMDTNDDGILDAIDSDGDEFADSVDNAPFNSEIHRTDFNKHLSVPITPNSRRTPLWKLKSNGTEAHQMLNSDPGILVGSDAFSSVEYTGTLYVDTTLDDDIIGFVFNYQSNRRFMVVSWKKTTQSLWSNPKSVATAGLQIQLVKSNTGPHEKLANALWHSGDTKRQVKTLYHDPLNRGWEHQKAYRWNLQYSSQSLCMRLKVYDENGLFDDSGCVCDKAVRGGRLGLYVFSQEHVIFSNLKYKTLSNEQEVALAQC